MKLHSIRLCNFRCFQAETSITFDDITVLIGKNDAGKSSIMEALDIFLNEGVPDKDDATKDGDPKELEFVCEFKDLPQNVVIDDTTPTSLFNEHLLNEERRLEIHKKYSGHLTSPKLVSVSARAVHPTSEGSADLLQLKNSDLKKRAKELNVDLTGVDQKVNAELRNAIRNNFDDLSLSTGLIPLNEANAKDIWLGLKSYLPTFALFKSDRQSTDQDPEAQDPLKAAIKEAIKCKQTELDAIATHVGSEVRKIAQLTLEKLNEMDPTLATQLNPQFTPLKWESIFKASFTGDDDIPINKRGSGVKRLILLNFFRAKAEKQRQEAKRFNIIYGIEEPETSQHPNNQRMLLRALTDLSTESQVVVSTHTPMLARSLPDYTLRYIDIDDNGTRQVLVGGNGTNQKIAKALGVLPDNNVKLFIGVEEKHDIAFLQTVSKMLVRSDIDIPDLEKLETDGEIIFFPLGGSNLAIWTSRLEKLNRPEFHLYDRDTAPPSTPKYSTEATALNERDECLAIITGKKELENYIHWQAIKQAYNDICNIALPIESNFAPFDDVPAQVAKMVHQASESPHPWEELDSDKKREKERQVKHILNTEAPKYMSIELINEIDPDGDLLSWFKQINTLLNQLK